MSLQTRNAETTEPRPGSLPCVVVTPCGFNPSPPHGFVALQSTPRPRTPGHVRAALSDTVGSDPTIWRWWRARRPVAAPQLAALRRHIGVVDHPDLHRSETQRGALLANLLVAGLPVVVADPSRMDILLGSKLAEVLRTVVSSELTDPLTRERLSITLRREALRHFGPPTQTVAGTAPRRAQTVSILCATMRPDQLDHVIQQMNRQEYGSLECVLALHGDAFPSDAAQYAARNLRSPHTVLRQPSERSFGDVLNAATAAASGELVTKMDDDDDYGPNHCMDLKLAWQYSGATLVGKAAEFVHLEGLGMTLRRFSSGGERWHDLLAGGTLLLSREDLARAGGWSNSPRRVDRLLIEALKEQGGSIYRTHGFEYVLRRHAQSHTWQTEYGYFLRQSDQQWRNLPVHVIAL